MLLLLLLLPAHTAHLALAQLTVRNMLCGSCDLREEGGQGEMA